MERRMKHGDHSLAQFARLGAEPMQSAARATPIDLLRILAASSIFYFHSGQTARWPLFQWGEFAVATFIYLTTFCAMRYSKFAAGQTRAFWWSRFKAIYPTFAIISAIIYAVSYVYAPPKTGCPYAFRDFAANLLMISQYVGKPWMTKSMWFIPFVLQIYLVMPLILRIPVRLYTIPAAFLVSGTACAAVYAMQPGLTDHSYGICRNWSPIFRAPELLLGCLLARARSKADAVAPVAVYVVCSGLVATLAILYPQASLTLLLPLRGVLVFLVLAAAAVALLPFIKSKGAGVIALLGRAAFPFFLLHAPGIGFMSDRFGQSVLPWILYFVLCWAGAVAFVLALAKIQRRSKIIVSAEPGRCRA
jgi:peptidoglycan/LPS O-acetylase OafA/YrhL